MAESVYSIVMAALNLFNITIPFPIKVLYLKKWVEFLGVDKGVWSVPTFRVEKLATMCSL